MAETSTATTTPTTAAWRTPLLSYFLRDTAISCISLFSPPPPASPYLVHLLPHPPIYFTFSCISLLTPRPPASPYLLHFLLYLLLLLHIFILQFLLLHLDVRIRGGRRLPLPWEPCHTSSEYMCPFITRK